MRVEALARGKVLVGTPRREALAQGDDSLATHIKKRIKLKEEVPFLRRQLKLFEANPLRFVMLLHVDKEVECKAKVLGTTNEFGSHVPSCRNGSNHKEWSDFDPITAGFEVGAKCWAVENPLSEIGEL
jgi:hypothetical protein